MIDNVKKIEAKIIQRISKQYQKKGSTPWIVTYSGGKDSTLVLHLVIKYLSKLKYYKRKVYVVCNDTLVESPFVMQLAKYYIKEFEKYTKKNNIPITYNITKPEHYDTFWVNIIGRGYPPPSRMFRWCTDRMKIKPT